jgi:hypothetical protein
MPWLNTRFALQYVAYTKFNGSKLNYDGAGRNASDNNTGTCWRGWCSSGPQGPRGPSNPLALRKLTGVASNRRT